MTPYVCSRCATRHQASLERWRCDCGAPLDLVFEAPRLDVRAIARRPRTLDRYREALPLPDGVEPVNLGAGVAPVVEDVLGGGPVRLALEYVSPTGSFKDRGAAVLAAVAAASGAREVLDDTSGNAGIALAAHAARLGLRARIFAPEEAAPAKLRIASSLGAEVVPVPGGRAAAATAASAAAASPGAFYASHAWSPYFVHGTKTFAYSLAEALGWLAPGAVVLPAGNGSLALGAHLGFGELARHGTIGRLPALVVVQAARCAPLHRAFEEGRLEPSPVGEAPTIADGVRVAAPVRGARLLAAVRESGGLVAAVEEEDIEAVVRILWRKGYAVEPTGALAAAFVHRSGGRLRERYGSLVVALTGSGLKG